MRLPKQIRRWLPKKRRKKRSGAGRQYVTRQAPKLQSQDSQPTHQSSAARPPQAKRRKKRTSRFRRILKRCFKWSLVTLVAFYLWFSIGLPDIEELNTLSKVPSIIITSPKGDVIGSYGDVYGEFVHYEDIPASLIDAVIATEDRHFYRHFGIDPLGLTRAAIANIRAKRVVQGGSTITQQVAKNVFLTPERTYGRKIREMLLAFKLEWRYSKQEILSIYLNRVYLGAGTYGVDAAAHRYFDKSATELSLGESATIAGLLKAPSRFAPTSNPELSRKRAEQVLINMQDAGYLSQEQVTKARSELTKTINSRKRTSQSNMYFTDWIMDQLPEYVGNVEDDLVVTSTLLPEMQVIAEKAVNDVMDKSGEKLEANQAALLAMAPDGAVRAMIGGRNYADSQYNRTTQSLRQPGSAFKLFVYLTALEGGMEPDEMLDDTPINVGKWQPKNYNGRYEGPMTMADALAESVNTIAVQLSEQFGRGNVINTARRLGIAANLDPLPSLALGATELSLIDLTTAYAHLAAEGNIVHPYGILDIKTSSGKSVYKRKLSKQGIVLRPDIVGMMNGMLSGVIEHGTGRSASIGRSAAGKTGTTSDYKDAWFMGYTPDLTAGVWVGNDDNHPMKKVTGGMLPAMIWRQFMSQALAKTPAHALPISHGNDAPAPLPWQANRQDHQGVELGTSFWEKLMGVPTPR